VGPPHQEDFEVDPLLCVCGAEMKIVSISPTSQWSIGFSDTCAVRRAASGTRSSRARHRRPVAIPCNDFQRRPLEHSDNLVP
jgi:hypothetical protein